MIFLSKFWFSIGLLVFAKWRNNHWYPGSVTGTASRKRLQVRFDDGNLETVVRKHVIFCSLLAVGQHCFAERHVSWAWKRTRISFFKTYLRRLSLFRVTIVRTRRRWKRTSLAMTELKPVLFALHLTVLCRGNVRYVHKRITRTCIVSIQWDGFRVERSRMSLNSDQASKLVHGSVQLLHPIPKPQASKASILRQSSITTRDSSLVEGEA